MSNEARCLAWQHMYRQRHCPSLKVLRQGGPQAERHLAACPYCRTALEHAAEAAVLGAKLLELPLTPPPASDPVPGDIRALRPGIDPAARVDADGTYYNPPLLLVLSRPDANGCVRVAQIFDEPDLQDEGDIPLDFDLIAEAWNTYDVPCSALDTVPYAHVGQELAETVLVAARGPFPDIEEFSPLFSFRSDECRTGSFFSLPLNLENLRRLEEAAPSAKPCRVIAFSSLSRSGRGASEEDTARAQDCLRHMLDFPCSGDGLALAAAESLTTDPRPAQRIAVTVSRTDQGDGAPQPCAAELRIQPLADKTLCSIDCRLPAPLPLVSFAVRCGEREPLALAADWLEEDVLRIDAVFDGQDLVPAELRVAVLLSGQNLS